MRKNYKYLVLEKLADIGECSLETLRGVFDIADAMISSKPEAYRKLKRHRERYVQLIDRRKLHSEMVLANTLSRLKKEGLVVNKKRGQWRLTKKGKRFFELLAKKLRLKFLERKLQQRLEEKAESKEKILVIFDIPESEKKKREWLRAILRSLNFKPLQKSVWIGKGQLPEEFIEMLQEMEILPFVQIFTVVRKGTIKDTDF